MIDPRASAESPVFERARGLAPAVAVPVSPWTLAVGVLGAVLLGVVVFVSLGSARAAKEKAAERAYQAAHSPRLPPASLAAVALMSAPPQAAPTIAPASAPASGAAATTAAEDKAARLHAPAMVVDFSEGRTDRALADQSAAATPAVAAAAAPAGNDKLSPEEGFAERVETAQADTAYASRLANPSRVAPQGTVIPAVLETAINSDLPGFTRAVVTRDVRGFDGTRVLIPRGSKLIGQYRSGVTAGQTRAFVVWSRVLTPDGVSIDIGSPGADRLGRGGLDGETDDHFFHRFGASVLLSVLNGGLDALAAGRSGGSTAIVIGSPQQADNVAAIALQKQIDIPPTIKVPQGEPIRVFVARDLDFSTVGDAGAP